MQLLLVLLLIHWNISWPDELAGVADAKPAHLVEIALRHRCNLRYTRLGQRRGKRFARRSGT
jgi:hypothetical protein